MFYTDGPFICFGDKFREMSQTVRAGGAACIDDPKLAPLMRGLIKVGGRVLFDRGD